ncbi:pentatricopeptide repeat-containing protein At1g50270 [Cajanus cajan]|uniref:pentatricopeptide repeat-containing protein At1g50270 n=1 Tax=Cajanus cajan TaxID=3821 RepID=UPI00098D9096|nr:pentatricopeptide repeat-containing protein At1g50270 [Cajanus cajan]
MLSLAGWSNTLVSLFNKHQTLEQCKQIQSIIVTSGLYSTQHTLFLTKLIQCVPFSNTSLLLLFNTIHSSNTRLFNKIIAACSHPFLCYAKMRQKGVQPDKHTFPLLLKTLSKTIGHHPFMLYAQIFKLGFDLDLFVSNTLIPAFANSGFMESARQVFDESPFKGTVAWTALINGYVKNDSPAEALKSFVNMRSMGMVVDAITVASVLRAAALVGDANFGKWVHGFYVESGKVRLDGYICSALMDMYFKCGLCEDACKVFNEMPYRNVVCWTVLVAGYVQSNKFQDALRAFWDMLLDDVVPNDFTFSSVLTACAHMGALDQGRLVHEYIESNKINLNAELGTALVDMYAKCGCIDDALRVFENLPVKNVYTWTAIIHGLAVHGDAIGALHMFSCMLKSGIQPNEVTFVGVLAACSHGGFVEEGKRLFELMRHSYNLKPEMDHYGCMVDMLGRAGYLEDAKQIIDNMPMKPSPGVLGALFGACMVHKDFEMGEHIGILLVNQKPNDSGSYALLTNLYKMCQNWEAAAQVRKVMKGLQVEKTPGYSWIEVDGFNS